MGRTDRPDVVGRAGRDTSQYVVVTAAGSGRDLPRRAVPVLGERRRIRSRGIDRAVPDHPAVGSRQERRVPEVVATGDLRARHGSPSRTVPVLDPSVDGIADRPRVGLRHVGDALQEQVVDRRRRDDSPRRAVPMQRLRATGAGSARDSGEIGSHSPDVRARGRRDPREDVAVVRRVGTGDDVPGRPVPVLDERAEVPVVVSPGGPDVVRGAHRDVEEPLQLPRHLRCRDDPPRRRTGGARRHGRRRKRHEGNEAEKEGGDQGSFLHVPTVAPSPRRGTRGIPGTEHVCTASSRG